MNNFTISCESTVDLPYTYIKSRNIEVIKYSYLMNEKVYEDNMCEDEYSLPNFYKELKAGSVATTTQINQQSYYDYFWELLKKTDKILHIAFSSGLSGSVSNAFKVAEEINESNKDKKIVVIDSSAASSGYGLLVDMVADLRDEGKTLEQLVEWININKLRIHHYVCPSDLFFLKRGGRISTTQAFIGDLLNVHPLIYVNKDGQLRVFSKVRGRKKSFKKKISLMEKYAENGIDYSGKCFISHSNSIEDAEYFRILVEEHFPKLKNKVKVYDIGAVIGSHTGQGTISLFFYGTERPNLT